MGEKTAVIYARVSTARQADDGRPVASQIDQCRNRAAALGADVVQVFRDDGVSGRTSARPAFLEAIDYCDAHRVHYFVCWSTSRFARNRLDAAIYKRLLSKAGTRLVYASQDFGDNDDAWLAEAIVEVMDEQYSRTIAKDTRRSMRKNAADGYWNGGHIPFGFQAVPAGKRRRLAPLEGEAAVVTLIFRRYLAGSGFKELAERLNLEGVSRRGRRWDKNSVRSVITSPAVIGRLKWRTGDETITSESHQAIVTVEEFEMAQDLMTRRAPRNEGGRHRSEAVFVGLLRCGECGEAMMIESATGRGGSRYQYYNCRSFLKGMGCDSRRVPVAAVDEALLEAIVERIFTPENLSGLIGELKQAFSDAEVSRQARIDQIALELADVKRRLERQYEVIEGGTGMALSDVATRIRELQARERKLLVEADRVADAPPEIVELTEDDLDHAVRVIRDAVREADPQKARQFLAGIVKKASIKGEIINLEYRPDCIVSAASGSQCAVSWLPDLGSNQGPAD